MRINYNAPAMRAVNALNKNDNAAAASTERLSSGLKINRAKDNPSGYALSRKMRVQLQGLSQAGDNASDAINIIRTADGALSEVHSMLQRMNELAVKSANGTWADSDRQLMNDEVAELKDEIQRVANTTQFNGQNLLNGSFDLKAYTSDVNVKVTSYSDSVPTGVYTMNLDYEIDGTPTPFEFDENGNISFKKKAEALGIEESELTAEDKLQGLKMTCVEPGGDPTQPKELSVTEIDGNRITLKSENGFSMILKITEGFQRGQDFKVDVTGLGAMTVQIGANEGQVLDLRIPDVGIENLGLKRTDVLTKDSALEAIDAIGQAIIMVSSARSRLGAYQNRLESTSTTLDITSENMTESFSSITDVDMSEEYTQYSTYQILTQATTSVLAQANERPSQILQLLQ